MIVHKFGGTSISDASGFQAASQIILDQVDKEPDRSCAVVLSAVHGVSDKLVQGGRLAAQGNDRDCRNIRAALVEQHQAIVEDLPLPGNQRRMLSGVIEDKLHEVDRLYRSIAILGELTRRGRDTIAAFGPILSAHILVSLLKISGVQAEPINTAALLHIDNSLGAAAPMMEPTRKAVREHLIPKLKSGILPVLTASIGTDADGSLALLERGGGDTSAVSMASALDAGECIIWTDVIGILTADPSFVPDAVPLAELTYSQALELARFGVDVIHTDTLLPGAHSGFPLQIRSSFYPSQPGTRISNKPSLSSKIPPAILSMAGLAIIVVQGEGHHWSLHFASRILDALHHTGIEVLMFNQPMSTPELNIVVRQQDQEFAIQSLQQILGQKKRSRITCENRYNAAIITIVSLNGSGTGINESLFGKTLSALGTRNTRIFAIARSTEGTSLSFCIPEDNCRDLVVFLHQKLIME